MDRQSVFPSIISHLRTIVQLSRAISSRLRHISTIGRKNLLSSNFFSTCFYNMAYFGPLTAEIGSGVWGTPANFNGVRILAHYYSDVTHRRPTKLCAIFGRLLGWYTVYTFSGALAPWRNFVRCKLTLRPSLAYWQRYCTAIQQRASAKLCGVVRGMELLNFHRGRHLYSAGRPSGWASVYILFRIFWHKTFPLTLLLELRTVWWSNFP